MYGFGLVIGLNGTGGSSLFTQQVAVDMMKYFCVNLKIVQQVQTDNVFRSRSVSAVIMTAEIGPFARIGSRLDVTVSILDNASSLQGGTLLFTPLKGADGVVYAVPQGALSVGGFQFGGAAASAQKNYVSVARIPGPRRHIHAVFHLPHPQSPFAGFHQMTSPRHDVIASNR